ncbi:MAG TPA: hypothetical protein VLD35_00675, partial [Caldimonas sp.]|nr:hypothetical protein [Caldimonas sp.]
MTAPGRPGRRAVDRRAGVVALLASIVPLGLASAASGDPLESPECRRALAALNAEEAAVAETPRARGGIAADERRRIEAKLAPARRQAARACLARQADPATLSSQRLERQPPVATAPLAVAPASAPTAAPATTRAAPPSPPAVQVERPYAITSCDPGGC